MADTLREGAVKRPRSAVAPLASAQWIPGHTCSRALRHHCSHNLCAGAATIVPPFHPCWWAPNAPMKCLFQNKFARCRMARPVPCRVLSHDPAIASASALAEIQPAFVVVVATAPQLDLVDGRLAPESVRIDVVKLDEPALIAPVPVRSDEAAAPEIPHPDRTLDRRRGIARTCFRPPRRARQGPNGGGDVGPGRELRYDPPGPSPSPEPEAGPPQYDLAPCGGMSSSRASESPSATWRRCATCPSRSAAESS